MARIISVEDDELISVPLSAALTRAGHLVGVIPNGALALQTIAFKPPDLVILDCALPGMPGIEILRRLRRSSATYLMPILMLTGHRRERDIDSAIEAGANAYLTKPFDTTELVDCVERLLEEGALHRLVR
ncbi:response regulator transcription factor [Sphingosinithalassobacter portus]|uniref:response regulator transcription factor n=1 Tax=Stakelama portus TaxID=2676234 RepID=UPI000D6E7D36|nr:response regulator transcription factor [Sphingosinithalassobacter portus]